MALSVEKTTSGREYKVKDMSQADFGRLEIELAEVEMPTSSSEKQSQSLQLQLLHLQNMADRSVTLERNDEQPQEQQRHDRVVSTKRFHIAFTSFKFLVIASLNSQYSHALSYMVTQLYIVFEAIYLIALIKLTGPESPNMIYRYLYIIFGTLGAELLLWTSLSLAMWVVVNMCLLLFALASSGQLGRGSNWFQEIVQPLDDEPFSEVQLDL